MKQRSVNFISEILFPLQQEAKTTSKHTSPTEASDLCLWWRLRHVTWKGNPNVDIDCLNCFFFCSSQTSQFFEESHSVIIRQNTNTAKVILPQLHLFQHEVKDYSVCHFDFKLFVGVLNFFIFSKGPEKTLLFLFENGRKKMWWNSHRLE